MERPRVACLKNGTWDVSGGGGGGAGGGLVGPGGYVRAGYPLPSLTCLLQQPAKPSYKH